jgi:hypothetical protein
MNLHHDGCDVIWPAACERGIDQLFGNSDSGKVAVEDLGDPRLRQLSRADAAKRQSSGEEVICVTDEQRLSDLALQLLRLHFAD